MIVREVFLFFAIISSTVYCEKQKLQTTTTVPDLWRSIEDNFNEKESFSGFQQKKNNTGNFNITTILKAKCEKNAKENPFASGQEPFKEAKECVDRYIDEQEVLKRISKGQTTDMHNMICDKRSQLKECSKKLAAKLRPCLSAADRPHVDDMLEAESQLMDYVCYNNGERIKRFVNEGVPKCIFVLSMMEKNCTNELADMNALIKLTYANITADDDLFERPNMKKLCPKVMETKECVVRVLGRCDKPYPSEFVDSVLNIILRGTPCKHLVPSDGPSALVVVGAVAGAVLLVAMVAFGFYCWRRRQYGSRF